MSQALGIWRGRHPFPGSAVADQKASATYRLSNLRRFLRSPSCPKASTAIVHTWFNGFGVSSSTTSRVVAFSALLVIWGVRKMCHSIPSRLLLVPGVRPPAAQEQIAAGRAWSRSNPFSKEIKGSINAARAAGFACALTSNLTECTYHDTFNSAQQRRSTSCPLQGRLSGRIPWSPALFMGMYLHN